MSELRALISVHRGEYSKAERLAREAVRLSGQTDAPLVHGDAHFDLGLVLEAAGRPDEAACAYRHALESYEHKQAVALARLTRERLAAVSGESAHSPMPPRASGATMTAPGAQPRRPR
jgi:tetratricopeptide (TPR) repeat protein